MKYEMESLIHSHTSTSILIHESEFEIVVCERAVIFPRGYELKIKVVFLKKYLHFGIWCALH